MYLIFVLKNSTSSVYPVLHSLMHYISSSLIFLIWGTSETHSVSERTPKDMNIHNL